MRCCGSVSSVKQNTGGKNRCCVIGENGRKLERSGPLSHSTEGDHDIPVLSEFSRFSRISPRPGTVSTILFFKIHSYCLRVKNI
eukprot:scaffold104082_cov38-Cyclotella_meneghiniana.AAC.2